MLLPKRISWSFVRNIFEHWTKCFLSVTTQFFQGLMLHRFSSTFHQPWHRGEEYDLCVSSQVLSTIAPAICRASVHCSTLLDKISRLLWIIWKRGCKVSQLTYLLREEFSICSLEGFSPSFIQNKVKIEQKYNRITPRFKCLISSTLLIAAKLYLHISSFTIP